MQVNYHDLENAYQFVNTDQGTLNTAWMCKKTDKIYLQSENIDFELEEPPPDIENADLYLAIPNQYDLDLSKGLVFKFARKHLPHHIDDIDNIFRHSGAYRRFKDFLEKQNKLDTWYEYENSQTEAALKEWCEDNNVELIT